MYATFRANTNSEKLQSKNRKHVTTACEDCRKGRIKCDGESPCSSCVKKKRSCTYGERPDHRRAVTKRKLEDLQQDSELLHDLVRRMRQDSNNEYLLSLIKSGASLQSIREAVDAASSEQPTDDSDIPSRSPPRQRQALAISRLTDQPPFRVKASRWTSVTDDDHLCSHLISLFFTHGNDFNFSVVRPLFLKDAEVQASDPRYCSAFLFNCVLAEACIYSDWPEARAKGGKASDLMTRFIAEAKEHLAKESSKYSLCTMQGLLILFFAVAIANQDKEGYLLLVQSIVMSQELLHNQSKSEATKTLTEDEQTYEAATKVACWGLFHVSRTAYLAWMRHHFMPVPPMITDEVWKNCQLGVIADAYTGYPYSQESKVHHKRDIVNAWGELAVIGDEVCILLFSSSTESLRLDWGSLVSRLAKAEEQLEAWGTIYSHVIAPVPGAIPEVYVLHLWQHCLMLVITNAIRKPPERELSDSETKLVSKAETNRLQRALRVAELCKIYASEPTGSILNINTVQAAMVSIWVLVEHLDDKRVELNLTNLFIYVRSMAKRLPYIASILRMVQLQVKERQIELPETTRTVMENFEKQDISDWTSKDVNCMYPTAWASDMKINGQGSDTNTISLSQATTMEDFLRQLEDLSVAE